MKMKTTGSTCIQQPSSTIQSISKYQKGKFISPYYNYDTEQGRRRLQPSPSSLQQQQQQQQQQQHHHHQQYKNSQNNNNDNNKNGTIHPFFLQKYKLECNILGKGGYGVVLLATDQVTNQRRAVKFIYKNKIPTSGWVVCDKTILFRSSSPPITTTVKTKTNKLSSSLSTSSSSPSSSPSSLSSSSVTQKTCIPTEIYLLQKLNHPNIIKMFNVYQDDTFYYLVMETHGEDWSTPITSHDHHSAMKNNNNKLEDSILLNNNNNNNNNNNTTSGGKHADHAQDLFECIEQHHHLSESIAQYIFKQLIHTVLYLKQNGIYHRDIKDENILIDRRYNIKLIDFGSAITIDTSKRQWISSFYGTLAYGSPEILCGRIYEPEPAEVWSLGVLLYTMLFGQVPFSTPLQVINGHYHSSSIQISKQCSNLLNMLLRKSPLHRPSIEEIANHNWLSIDL